MNEALDHYEVLGRAEDIGRLGWAMVYQLTWNGRLIEAVAVCRRAMTPLGDTASADKARLLSALGRRAKCQRRLRHGRGHVRPGARAS